MVLMSTTSCAGDILGPTSESCVSWVDVADPQRAFDEADAVVIGTAQPTGDTTEMLGVDATVHELAVDDVIKGDLGKQTSLRVASTPVTCSGGGSYPDGDPLVVAGPVIVFLHTPDGGEAWSLITPFDTVLPLPADGSLPFDR